MTTGTNSSPTRKVAQIGDILCPDSSLYQKDTAIEGLMSLSRYVVGETTYNGNRALVCNNGTLLLQVNGVDDGYYWDATVGFSTFFIVPENGVYLALKREYIRETIRRKALDPDIAEKVYDLMKQLIEEKRGSKDPSFVF